MDLLDSDIFVLDLRYPNDARKEANRSFLQRSEQRRATTIYNVLEVCGIMSFNLSHQALLTLYGEFGRRYKLDIFFPPSLRPELHVSNIFAKITQKMTYGDAQILWTA